MKNPLPALFPVTTRVVNAVRDVEPNQVVVRPEYPLPYAPTAEHQVPQEMPLQMPPGIDLRTYQMMQVMHHQMVAAQTLQTAQLIRALVDGGRPENLYVYTTHNVDRSTHDNSTKVDARRWTKVDSRHIEAKKPLHADWGFVLIIIFLLGLAIIGGSMVGH